MTKGDAKWSRATREQEPWELSLVIDTDTYSGNFERELTAAALGVTDGTCPEADTIADAYEGPSLDKVVGVITDDHGYDRRCEMWPTPGYSDDGHGNRYEVTPDRPAKCHAYQSVRVPLNRSLRRAEAASVIERAKAFAASGGPTYDGFQMVKPFRVLGFRLMRSRRTLESIPMPEAKKS